MIVPNLIKTLLFVTIALVISCGTVEKKAKQIGDKVKSKGSQLIDTAIIKAFREEQPKEVGANCKFALSSVRDALR